MNFNVNEYKVIDNFLPIQEFETIKDLLFSNTFPYFYNPAVSHKDTDDDHFIFYHILLDDDVGINSRFFELFYHTFFTKINAKEFRRCRVNNYTKSCSNVTHKFHTDREYDHNVALWYCNTCNGPTVLKLKNKERISGITFDAKDGVMVSTLLKQLQQLLQQL